jgi:hypothetical protein
MFRIAYIAASAVLLLSVDVTQVSRLRQQTENQAKISPDDKVPVLPDFDSPGSAQEQTQPSATKSTGPLTEENRLQILRGVSGEFARMVTPLPAGKNGFRIKAGEPVDKNMLQRAVGSAGAAVNPGDNIQITKIEFRGRDIALDINGGGKGRRSWRDHIGVDATGPVMPVSSGTTNGPNVPAAPKNGATLFLDFGRALPDMTPDDVKQYLAVIFDFSRQRSAAVQWMDTLPPRIQQAIQEKRADVGMDRDEVLAAMGRPERKVRERAADGTDTEDWIYGHPPAKTVFVRFAGEKVVQVDQYPR